MFRSPPAGTRPESRATRRRGVVSVLAMVFLVIFAVLAVGFAEAVVFNGQIARNERGSNQAMASADAGMAFIRYQFASFTMPQGTDATNLLANTAAKLGTLLNGTGNMGTSTVSVVSGAINIPSAAGWVTPGGASKGKFRITITQNGTALVVTSHGASADGATVRGVQMQFKAAPKPYALMGINSVSLSGGAFADSWDSSLGAYAAATAKAGGTIASDGNVTLANTTKVNGDLRYGPGATVTLAPTATVTGVVAPLRTSITFPSVSLPATYTDLGDVTMTSGVQHIPGGTYVIGTLSLSGTPTTFPTIYWDGPVKLYIRNGYTISGNVVINTYQNKAINRQLFFLPTCTTASWSGTNVNVGDLYAPDTAFTIGGTVENFGRVIAKSITDSSSKGMHYDESLPSPEYHMVYAPDRGSYVEVP